MKIYFFKNTYFIYVLGIILSIGCIPKLKVQPVEHFINLNGKWELYFGPQDDSAPQTPDELLASSFRNIEAQVPGNVELDLIKANILPDIKVGNNIFETRKFETYQWWYKKIINLASVSSEKRTFLVFDGIDCIASIWLNNNLIGNTDNMFIQHQFDITDVLKRGENKLYVQIKSPIIEARKYELTPYNFAFDSNWESLSIRKAPHMYGWNIMPRLVSAGIWRDVYMETKPNTQFRSVYWVTKQADPEKKTAILFTAWDFETDISNLDGCNLSVQVSNSNGTIVNEEFPVLSNHGSRNFNVKDVELWWPKGFGEQQLYDAELILKDINGKIISESKNRIGIRTVHLEYSDVSTKESPGKFQFVVNGYPVFVKGTNWVPLDAIHSKDQQHLPNMFEMLKDLNCNMVRCWGGNVYEDTDFYDLCDEKGIMVWQDFSLACGRYPQNNEFLEKMETEATSVVKKFRNHPSLVLWAGDNENDITRLWDGSIHLNPNDDLISRKVLKNVIRNYDPFCNYLPSSPYVTDEIFNAGFDRSIMPENHLWMRPRGRFKDPFYTETNAVFASEIGFHGCPNLQTLKQMFHKNYLIPDYKNRTWNSEWQTKSTLSIPIEQEYIQGRLTRNDFMVDEIEALFGECPNSFEDFIFASQAAQAEAFKFSIDFWRSRKPQKMGIIWWNLRDGWPIISDAVVDYYYRKKIAYDFIKQAQNDVQIIVCESKNEFHEIKVVNDTREDAKGSVEIYNVDNNEMIFSAPYTVLSNTSVTIGQIKKELKQQMWKIRWHDHHHNNFESHYLEGNPPFNLQDYKSWFKKIGFTFN